MLEYLHKKIFTNYLYAYIINTNREIGLYFLF